MLFQSPDSARNNFHELFLRNDNTSRKKGFASFGIIHIRKRRECTRTRLRVHDVFHVEFDKRVTYNDTTTTPTSRRATFCIRICQTVSRGECRVVVKRGGIRWYFVVDIIPSRACHINNRLVRPRRPRASVLTYLKQRRGGNLRDCDSQG